MANERQNGPGLLMRALLDARVAEPSGGGLAALASILADDSPRQERRGLLNYASALENFTALPPVDEITKRLAIWQKAYAPVPSEAHIWRIDPYGSRVHYANYGDRDSPFGWEYGHLVDAALGGSDDISNLRPLHWRNNASDGGLLGTARRRGLL